METFYSNKLQKTVKQVNKTTARKLWNKGVSIFLHPSKMRFDNPWQQPYLTSKSTNNVSEDFDQVHNDYRYYNCDSERGKYIHFFVTE